MLNYSFLMLCVRKLTETHPQVRAWVNWITIGNTGWWLSELPRLRRAPHSQQGKGTCYVGLSLGWVSLQGVITSAREETSASSCQAAPVPTRLSFWCISQGTKWAERAFLELSVRSCLMVTAAEWMTSVCLTAALSPDCFPVIHGTYNAHGHIQYTIENNVLEVACAFGLFVFSRCVCMCVSVCMPWLS